jgi:hypothetical protein
MMTGLAGIGEQPAGTVSFDAIAAVTAALARPRDSIEAAFVGIGGRLVECAGVLNRISAIFEALPAALEGPEIVEATGRLAALGQRARQIEAAFGTEEEIISELARVVAKADYPVSALKRAAKTMGIVAINARVVAAGIVGEAQDFDVFTKDIARFSEDAAATIAEFCRTYHKLTLVVAEAAEARRSFANAHRHTLTGLAAALETNLAAVTARRRHMAAHSGTTEQASRRIAQRVASIVMALQVGDATRQRIEHIEAALSGLQSATPEALVPMVLPLEERQLAAAAESFDREVAEADDELRALAGEAEEAIAASLEHYGHSGNGQSALGALNTEIRTTIRLLHACEAERRKLDAVAASVTDTVKVLLAHVEAVQDVEAHMRLVSLNAAVKCAQLGPKGRALDVISQQLRMLTVETVETAHQAVDVLSEAAHLADRFTATASGAAAGQMGDLEAEAGAALGALETVDARLEDALAMLAGEGPAVTSRLWEAVDVLSGHAELSESLRDVLWQLSTLSGPMPALDGATHEAVLECFSELRRRYTMEEERATHEAHLRTLSIIPVGAADAAPAPGASADGDLDALLF